MMSDKLSKKQKTLLIISIIVLSLLLVLGDYFSGPFIQFPITYLIPVVLTTWYFGFSTGLIFCFLLPTIRLLFNIFLWEIPWTIFDAITNFIIRVSVFSIISFLLSKSIQRREKLEKEVEVLSGLLPICSFCKKIRDEKNHWIGIEKYVSERSEAIFSHGLCPDCRKTHYSSV